jgi:hypothetical protein
VRRLRLGLVSGDGGGAGRPAVLADELRALGDDVQSLSGRGLEALEQRLGRRGYEAGFSRWPSLYLRLAEARPELVHAFSPLEAVLAARWAARAARPCLLTLASEVSRRWLLERRMRLEAVVCATRECTAVLVGDQTAAEALERALGVQALVIPPDSGAAHHALYERLIAEAAA